MTVFELSDHSLQYNGQMVWENLNLSISVGEKVAIVGPSGAGKSSLLRVLYQQQAQQVALCPQDLGLVEILSVYHNIYMGKLQQHSVLYNLCNLLRPLTSHRKAIEQLAEELGIEDKLFHSVDQLSGGQRQRVAIGRALYREQPIFLGDEPVSSLDPVQAESLLNLIVDRHETALVALHNRHLALSVFDRVIGIQEGAIRFDLAADKLTVAKLDAFYAEAV
jgi:phosphonate transport system ATP-binding protein